MFKDRDLKNQTVVVTGGTDGIGAQSVRNFYRLGATVIFTGRSDSKAKDLIHELTGTYDTTATKISYVQCEFSDFEAVISLATEIKKLTKSKGLNILVNNAGGFSGSKKTTKDNCDFVIQVNYFSQVLLTSELFPILQKTKNSRVIMVSSRTAGWKNLLKRGLNLEDINLEKCEYDNLGMFAYATSKLYEVLFAQNFKRFVQNLRGGNLVKNVSLHPGPVLTNIAQGLRPWAQGLAGFIFPFAMPFVVDVEYGAATSLHCATIDFDKLADGEFYYNCDVNRDFIPEEYLTKENGTMLWNHTVGLIESRVGKKLNFGTL